MRFYVDGSHGERIYAGRQSPAGYGMVVVDSKTQTITSYHYGSRAKIAARKQDRDAGEKGRFYVRPLKFEREPVDA